MSILQQLPQNRTLVMGILNVTPDSFSDGGLHYAPEHAVEHALDMVKQGADLIDVGGESTRPGAVRISAEEEQRRILPVIRELAARGVVMSVDTMNASTARAAVEAGAHIINDVSGMSVSAEMIETVAQLGVPYILMHARGDSTTMDSRASYENTVAEVVQELTGLKQRLLEAGVEERNIIVDPGLGFAKAGLQDWQLIAGIEELKKLGPVLVAGSRKRFVATLLKNEDERRTGAEARLRDSEGRDVATATISAFSALHGAWGVRVHAVRETADAIATVSAIRAGRNK